MYLFYFRNQTQFFKNVSKGEAYKYEAYMQRLCNRNDNEPPPLPKKPLSFKRLQYDRMLSGAINPKDDFDRDHIQNLLDDINKKILDNVMDDSDEDEDHEDRTKVETKVDPAQYKDDIPDEVIPFDNFFVIKPTFVSLSFMRILKLTMY